ncbi:hypothetical protein SCHPADRAFT_995953 [Schizopora paradoxa]|uniref:Uncharacterized protein n=1 Tax=Schizopora paradoxa TaxID=27342 RepID=A0A0H2S0M9_9AGAM|nr:hypothetical protein SCHPADRAFT_995953 [Schizopora paradoxa]
MATISEPWSLEEDLREVISSWLSHNDAIPACWRGEMRPIKAMPLTEAQLLGKEKCSELVSRTRKTALRLKSLSDTLSKLSSAMRTESEDAQANFKAVSKLYGLVSIPNELLARIFDHVVNRDDSESLTTKASRPEMPRPGDLAVPEPITTSKRSKEALSLSHVCRYFRDTALSCARLWPNVCRNKDLAAYCLGRTKHIPLNVHIFIGRGERDPISGSYGIHFDKLLQDILPHSDRLGGLEIDFKSYHEVERVDAGYLNVREAFRRLYAPALHSLRIQHQPNYFAETGNFLTNHEFDGWNVPNLRHLVTKHYFPLGLPGLRNLHSLEMTFDLGEIDFAGVTQSLSQMTGLSDFSLVVTVEESVRRLGQITRQSKFERVYLPSVRRLRIGINGAGYPYLSTASFMKALFSPLVFPGVTDLHFTMFSFIGGEEQREVSLNKELTWLCQHENQYSCVERLCLEAIDRSSEKCSNLLMDIPLAEFPNAKELVLCSNAQFKPSLHVHQEGKLPILEGITIKAVENGIKTIGPFVGSVMDVQRDRGNWGSFRELIVVNTRQVTMGDLGMEYPTRIYEGDAALQWCASGSPEIPTFA